MGTNKKSQPFVHLGSSSLLVIFLVLCLVTFATLSLSSAQNDDTFSQRLADRRTKYYTASNRAEEILDSIDAILVRSYDESPGTYFSEAQRRLNGYAEEDLDVDFSKNIPSVTYQVSVDEKQALSVILELNPISQTSAGFYRIRQWKVITTQEWSEDNTLNLMK